RSSPDRCRWNRFLSGRCRETRCPWNRYVLIPPTHNSSPTSADDRPSRKGPTQARSRETVRRLLEAANAEFAVNGFHTAQITRIAQYAGVSVGALYRFFPDKAALASALRDRYLEETAHGYRRMLDSVASADD